jgi:plastocyanin
LIPTRALRSCARLVAGAAVLVASLGIVPAEADAATTVTIRIGSTLSPVAASVAPGTRLTWINADGDRHRVRSRTGPVEFDSGNIEPGRSWSITLTAPGTYAYLDDRNREDGAYHGRVVVGAGSSATTPPSGGSGGGSTGGAGSTAVPPARATMAIGDRVFRPTTVTIAAGGSVTWRNQDDRDHTATGRTGSFDTGTLPPGGSATERFPTAGTFAFLCAIHPEMQGTVRVVRAGSTAPPPPAAPRPTVQPTTPPAGTGTTPAGPSARAAEIVDFAFAPTSLTVPAGTSLRWTNVGVAPHTVTAGDGSFDSGMLAAGASWSRTFDQAGTYGFACAVHPAMTGSIVVTAAAGTGTSTSPPPPAGATTVDNESAAPTQTVGHAAGAPAASADAVRSAADGIPAPESARIAVTPDAVIRPALAILATVIAVVAFGRLLSGVARP